MYMKELRSPDLVVPGAFIHKVALGYTKAT